MLINYDNILFEFKFLIDRLEFIRNNLSTLRLKHRIEYPSDSCYNDPPLKASWWPVKGSDLTRAKLISDRVLQIGAKKFVTYLRGVTRCQFRRYEQIYVGVGRRNRVYPIPCTLYILG